MNLVEQLAAKEQVSSGAGDQQQRVNFRFAFTELGPQVNDNVSSTQQDV